MLLTKLQIPQRKTLNITLMNRELQTLSEKSFLRLIQCNPPKDAAEDRSITTASSGIYRLVLSLHFPASPAASIILNLRPELSLQHTVLKPIRGALKFSLHNLNAIMH